MTAGEGNGPLQPLPVEAGIVALSDNPFLLDMAMARMMGFDYDKIPQLSHHREFGSASWGDFDPRTIEILFDGMRYQGIPSLPVLRHFMPPVGWAGHIEIDDLAAAVRKQAAGE